MPRFKSDQLRRIMRDFELFRSVENIQFINFGSIWLYNGGNKYLYRNINYEDEIIYS